MKSKLVAAIVLSVVAVFFATPTVAFAKSSNPTKTKSLLKKFKSLSVGAPFSQIQSYAVKLTALDPTKAKQYAKIGLKLCTDQTQITKLGKSVNKVVMKSDLTDAQKEKITGQVTKEADKAKPQPTPTPYQAFLGGLTPVLG